MVPFNDELLQGIELYSDGSQEGNRKVEAYKESLTGETYSRIADRMESWFGS